MSVDKLTPDTELVSSVPPERWDDWREYDPKQWPRKVEKAYQLVPTLCFNCEAGCGLVAWIDKESGEVRKFEGNPLHPGSRGRNCAKGPATINQIRDPERILYPMRRVGARGEGRWERISWDVVLDEIAARIRKAFREDRRNEVMYHVGRAGAERSVERVLKAWGIDGHNSHTNVCSASARLGYALWSGFDRPSPDHANAEFILLLSSHLETGHYFNPHAQRIIEAKHAGAKIAVMDPRLSNTASMADFWMPTYPGSESAVLLAMAKVILDEGLTDVGYLERWTNWVELVRAKRPGSEPTFAVFLKVLRDHLAEFTPEFAEGESGVPPDRLVAVARLIGAARGKFASHVWRNAAAGNLGGWQVARSLQLLTVLTGSYGTRGGTSPHGWNKYKPSFWQEPPAQREWNDLLFPREWPLSHYEMSFLLPHFLKEGRGVLDVYFTRVFNPVWTNPDGMTWIEALSDEKLVGLHACLTPTWSETAAYADYVLPMGHANERHDIQSQETHNGLWVGFRQPVLRTMRERNGETFEHTYEANPGEVWEEDEFWIELSWRIDPDGELGIRKWFESPYRPGEKLRIDEYYRWIFENAVPGLPETAAKQGLTALEYMRRYGVFEIEKEVRDKHLAEVKVPDGAERDSATGTIRVGGKAIGVEIEDGVAVTGFRTPSRKLEIYSTTLVDWGWPEEALPGYIRSHVHRSKLDAAKGEIVLLPTFRLPTLIHSRSGNAKYLNEISHRNPLWIHTRDAERLGIRSGDLVRVATEIGYFVNRAWVTESIAPGVVACSHHLGRWRRNEAEGSRGSSSRVELEKRGSGYLLRRVDAAGPFPSEDPDSSRIWWTDGGVHQNLAFPVHPDPVSGMHCWHQKVVVTLARPENQFGDVFVDTEKSMAVYREWLKLARPGPGPGGLRRPTWLDRPLRPAEEMFKAPAEPGES